MLPRDFILNSIFNSIHLEEILENKSSLGVGSGAFWEIQYRFTFSKLHPCVI